MKTALSLSLLIAFALLNSCKKNDKKTDTPTPAKKLKYLTQTTGVRGNITSFTNYTYDDQKRVSTAKTGPRLTTYTYKGNNLFSQETSDPTSGYRENIEYAYNDDGTIASSHDLVYRNDQVSTDILFKYVVVNGRVTERHYQIYVDKLTYDNKGNLTNFHSGQGDFDTIITYDDKLSSYTNGFPNPNGLLFSPNNVLSNTPSYDHASATTYTYSYDTDGYATGTISTTPAGITKTSFTYTEM